MRFISELVIYFKSRLFDEMRRVKRVGVWPVGVVGGLLAEHAMIDGQGEGGVTVEGGIR